MISDNEFAFDPYDADQIRAILESHTGASVNGALEQGVISKVSALAAQEHGDARKAVDTLYEAGKIAEKKEASTSLKIMSPTLFNKRKLIDLRNS